MTLRLWDIYADSTPDFIREMAACPEIQRLQDVGMNCGCEYTSFPRFREIPPYSRYDHSVGVALIVWNFTHDPAQAAAGLFHDIATPCFAHVVDFLKGDHLTQESTEDGTADMIENSPSIAPLLKKYGLSVSDVADYHLYPVADNDTPRLSADRLEYTLGNMVNFGFCGADTVRKYYEDLVVGENEEGAPEIMFRHAQIAREFFFDAMKCAEIYVCDVDRFAMQALSEILKRAMDRNVISWPDIYGTERDIIRKMENDATSRIEWSTFCAYHEVLRSDTPGEHGIWRKIPAKKRYIDPFVQNSGRVSAIFPDCRAVVEEFVNRSQDYWVTGI